VVEERSGVRGRGGSGGAMTMATRRWRYYSGWGGEEEGAGAHRRDHSVALLASVFFFLSLFQKSLLAWPLLLGCVCVSPLPVDQWMWTLRWKNRVTVKSVNVPAVYILWYWAGVVSIFRFCWHSINH
jgi:hypothetical protein